MRANVGVLYSCVGAAGACDYQTDPAMPLVSSVVKSDANTLKFTGTNLQMTGFSVNAKYNGVSSITSLSTSTSFTSTFANGIPLT